LTGSSALDKKMALVRPCDRRIVAACILGSIKEVMARVTSEASRAPDLEVVTDEVVNFGLRGIFFDPEGKPQSLEAHDEWVEKRDKPGNT
jgi:hypothetical protein